MYEEKTFSSDYDMVTWLNSHNIKPEHVINISKVDDWICFIWVEPSDSSQNSKQKDVMKNDFDNDIINAETWYCVYIYDGNNGDEIIEDEKIRGIKAAEEYGKKRKAELGKGYWYHVKVD